MGTILKKWIFRSVDRLLGRQLEDEPPCLPHTRPGVITPSSSQEALCQPCGFFEKLPSEIRRQILIHAFGGRRVHMDLCFDHPEMVNPNDPGNQMQHSGIYCDVEWGQTKRGLDIRKPKYWQWWGSVCHRQPPDTKWLWQTILGEHQSQAEGIPAGPWPDKCRDGAVQCCHEWPGSDNSKCRIGAMGWLLSCRQAYVEGIDILYTTNAIAMESEMMLSNIDRFILPQRLASLTAVEIQWPLRWSPPRSRGLLKFEKAPLQEFLESVPQKFPALRRFYLCFDAIENQEHIWLTLTPEMLLEPIDQMRLKLTNLAECVVAIPSTLFETMVYHHTKQDLEERLYSNFAFWRFAAEGHEIVLQPKTSGAYPRPPRRASVSDRVGGEDLGYWVFSGFDNGFEAMRLRTIMKRARDENPMVGWPDLQMETPGPA